MLLSKFRCKLREKLLPVTASLVGRATHLYVGAKKQLLKLFIRYVEDFFCVYCVLCSREPKLNCPNVSKLYTQVGRATHRMRCLCRHRGYNTKVRRYEFYFRVVKAIFYSLAALVRKIFSSPQRKLNQIVI